VTLAARVRGVMVRTHTKKNGSSILAHELHIIQLESFLRHCVRRNRQNQMLLELLESNLLSVFCYEENDTGYYQEVYDYSDEVSDCEIHPLTDG